VRRIRRGGQWYRICKPDWARCEDTSYSKRYGGRWNAPGFFGVLYLNENVAVAAANVRQQHARRAIKLFDLRPDRRPQLQAFSVKTALFVDVVSAEGVAAAGLPKTYPFGADYPTCRAVGLSAHSDRAPGIACRSYAESTATSFVGEELAVFDSFEAPDAGERVRFDRWYPDIIP